MNDARAERCATEGLAQRVDAAAEAVVAARGFVTVIEVLVGVGWLQPVQVERWRRGQDGGPTRSTLRLANLWADGAAAVVDDLGYPL